MTHASVNVTSGEARPVVLITGAAGNLGRTLAGALAADYRIAGLDIAAADADYPIFAADFSNPAAVELALSRVREQVGARIASVVHLVAYFDQTGEDNPLYQTVNVEGTRNLLRALQPFEVEQFVYASTMLVHAPNRPGEHMDEDQPFDPAYIYPKSKLAAEEAIRADHGHIRYVILRLAGVYDEKSVIPTLAQQIARIHGREFQGYLYAGSPLTGQSLLHNVWEPFFHGSPADPQNGTEEIITSHVAEAWPISDGGLGGITYILEILTGVIGLQARWRTMPWLVILFGLMIVPLSITSVSFVIIQPIMIGTWGTLTLIGAAAMLLQIPYAIDELLASLQFLRRRVRAGKNWLRVFFVGDTDERATAAATAATESGEGEPARDEFDRSPVAVVRDILGGGVSLPWNFALSGLIALSLLFTRLTFDSTGAMANADHVIGFLVLTTLSIAAAEPTRSVRYLNVLFGVALLATPFALGAETAATINSIACGIALILLSRRRGPIRRTYGNWTRRVV